jgi:hypothetical protein
MRDRYQGSAGWFIDRISFLNNNFFMKFEAVSELQVFKQAHPSWGFSGRGCSG